MEAEASTIVIDELRALQQQMRSLARQTEQLQAQLTELVWQYERADYPGGERMPAPGEAGAYGSRYAPPTAYTGAASSPMYDTADCTGRQNAFSAFRRPI